jgi:hypothetical protein
MEDAQGATAGPARARARGARGARPPSQCRRCRPLDQREAPAVPVFVPVAPVESPRSPGNRATLPFVSYIIGGGPAQWFSSGLPNASARSTATRSEVRRGRLRRVAARNRAPIGSRVVSASRDRSSRSERPDSERCLAAGGKDLREAASNLIGQAEDSAGRVRPGRELGDRGVALWATRVVLS